MEQAMARRSVSTVPERDGMSGADAAWLRMDRSTNLMVINAVMWFDEPIPLADVRAVLEERLVGRFRRFRQRAVESRLPGRAPHWEADPKFDLDAHLHRLALPAPGDQRELEELVGDLASTPLDRSRPLWHMYLIEGYGSGCAILARMHHSIADGIALARVLLSLTDDVVDAGLAPAHRTAGGNGSPLGRIAGLARATAGAVMHETLEIARHPDELLSLAAAAENDVATAVRLAATPADATTVLKGQLGVTKRVTWSHAVPLEEVKAIGRANDCTVNDVLVAAVSGSLRRYLMRRHDLVEQIRAFVPFNLRPLDEPLPSTLGNRFGLVFLPLPIGVRGTKARLRAVKREMDRIKASVEGGVAYAILTASGMTPAQVESVVIDLFSAKGTAVMTNVPGPRRPVVFAGRRLQGVLVWAPCSGSVSMSVSMFSYDGRVTVGFLVDAGLVPDPERLARGYEQELDHLAELSLRS
jgi:diacylglycerol O-acyltransferase / wax synthase